MPTNMGMSLPPTQEPSVWQRIQAGLLGPTQNYGGLLDPAQQQAAQRQGIMNMGASLLASSGWSPQKTTFGQALGPALMAGQSGQQQAIEASLNAALLQSQITKNNRTKTGTDAKSIQEYEYAKANGFTGSFEEWKRVASAKPQTPAGIQEYEYFQKLSPEQQKQFLSLQRSPVLPQLALVNGVPTLVDRTDASVKPLSTQQSEIEAAAGKKEAEAKASAIGTATGEAFGAIEKKAASAQGVRDLLEIADPLIDVATGSTVGAGIDKVASFFGKSLKGDQATAQLKILQSALMFAQPRMEGPQGVLDVKLYEQAAGEIGDPTVPRERRKAAIKTIGALQDKYASNGSNATKKPKRVRVDAEGNVIGD